MQVAAAIGCIGGSLQAGDIARHAPKFGAIGAIADEDSEAEELMR
jgi:hypothetical protein